MMKFIPIVLQAIFVFVGVMAGFWLKSAPAPVESEATAESGDHGSTAKNETKKKAKKKKSKADHGGGHEASSSADSGYMKFSRQFIVPVLDKSGVNSLVILELNIEVPSNAAQSLYVQEPKLRDVLLSHLLQLSSRGIFDEQVIEKKTLDVLRAELLGAAQDVIGENAKNILILNISRQTV